MPPVPPPEWPSAPSAPAPEPVRARLGIIGDPHIGARSSDGLVQALVHDLNRQGVDLAVAVGDLTQNGKAELLERARAVLGELEVPWAATLGNHDLWDAMWSGGTGEAGVERFMKVFGSAPHALWEVDGLRLVVINSADPTPSPFPPFDLVAGGFTDDPSETLPGGKISEEVAEWMATIEPGAPTFVVLHHPPYPYLGFPPIVFGLDARSTELVAGLVERTGAWGVFCGHTHRCSLSQLAGVPVIEFPSSKDWPFGYGLVEVGERGWSLNLQPITDRPLVEEASTRAGVLFRRYARGPDEARSFVWRL